MHTLQPQKYLQKVGTINNIKLTLREIDVVACVLSGKITKTMSSILGIETSTFETHYANIKKKLQINTKEHLITLVENYTSTVIYKSHASLLQVEQNIFEYAQEQTLEQKSFSLHVSRNSDPLFIDLLKRHMKMFNIALQIEKQIPQNTKAPLDLIFTPTKADNQNNKSLHVHFQNDIINSSDGNLYFGQNIEYFEFFITIIEKLNPNINTFYIKQKIHNILSKQEEGLRRIQEPVRNIATRSFQKNMNNMTIVKKVWILIGAITSVSSLTLLIPSISTQAIIQHNLQSIHSLGGNKHTLKREELYDSIDATFSNQQVKTSYTTRRVTPSEFSG